MPSGIAAFISGLGVGAVKGSQYRDQHERQDRKDALDQQEQQLRIGAGQRKAAGDAALVDAARPAVAEPNITNDDDGNPSSAPAARVVGPGPVQNFADPAAARAAAATTNAQPVQQRQVMALQGIDPERALTMQAAGQNVEAGKVTLDAAKQKAAEQAWQRALGAAMTNDFPGLEEFINANEAGPMKGKKVKFVPSQDGKTVTLHTVGEGGTLTPTTMTFPKDSQGLINAGYMLDKAVTPEHRAEFALKQTKEAREATESGAKVKESESKAGYYDALAGKNNVLAANGGAAPKKADHFDEKQWDAGAKIDKDLVSLPDPMGGDKGVQSGDLRSARMKLYNALRARGDLSPQEAAEQADTAVVNVKSLAQQRVEQAKAAGAKLTLDQAVKAVLKDAAKAAPAAPAAGDDTKISPATQAARDVDRAAILREELKKAQERLAAGDQRAQGDVDALTRELGAATPKSTPAKVAATMGAAAAPAKAAAPAAKMAAQGVQAPQDTGTQLDAARQAFGTANAALNAFGLRQRQQDPQGFANAQAAAAAARENLRRAEAAWTTSVGTMQPAFVAPSI